MEDLFTLRDNTREKNNSCFKTEKKKVKGKLLTSGYDY